MSETETIIWSILGTLLILYFTYKATKIGMVDDVINFVKYEVFKMKRDK